MNLSQISTVIGQRLGVDCSDPTSRDGAAVRGLVVMRHEQLWRSFLWKDSLLEYVIPIDTTVADYLPTSAYMPTKGHLILPSIISKVVACRTSENMLDVERPMIYFRVSPDEFTLSGTPLGYYLLPGCVLELDSPMDLVLISDNAADNALSATIDELQPDGVSVARGSFVAANSGTDIGTTDRLDRIIKPTSQGTIRVQTTVLGPSLIPAGSVYDGGRNFFPVALTPGVQYQITWGANEADFIYGSIPVTPTIVNPGAGKTSLFTFPAGGNFQQFVATAPGLPVTAQIATAAVYPLLVVLQPSDLSAPMRQRIRFMPIPSVNTTIRVLSKRVTPAFKDETDSPGVDGLDGILVALGYYDFCSRDERGGSPDAESALIEAVGPDFLRPGTYMTFGKPGGFLAHLIAEEVFQAAFNSRILPAYGFGEVSGLGPDRGGKTAGGATGGGGASGGGQVVVGDGEIVVGDEGQ